ncbi:MAG: preprotein translocase subunit SecG [Spirosomataceae bacterium]
MFSGIIVLVIIIAVLLMLAVLIQNPKGGGLNSQFGGSGSASQLFGVKKTTDLLEQITWGFAVAIAVLVMSTHFFVEKTTATEINSVNVEKAQSKTVPATPAPAQTQPSAPATQPAQQPTK